MGKSHYLKVRFSADNFQKIVSQADMAGISLSEFVGTLALRESEIVTLDQTLARVQEMLDERQGNSSSQEENPLLVETLLLLRELVAERSPQLLSRVAQKLDHRFGPRRVKL